MQRHNITQTYMNACDLYIESVKMEAFGYFYIVWKRGHKIAQTLKYQSDGKTTAIKQTLTLNITLQIQSGRCIEKNTALHILDAEGKQIDQITLPIHKWTSNFSYIELPLARGILKAKVRRKQLMMIKNEMRIDSEAEDIDSECIETRILIEENITHHRTFLDSHKDEMTKIRKELEDALYFNNKLKNDRTVLLSRNLEVEGQLTSLKKTMKIEMENMEKYFRDKVEIRENIYEDEINNMILAMDQNYESNLTVLKLLIHENEDLRRLLIKAQQENNVLKEQNKRINELEKINEGLERQNQESIRQNEENLLNNERLRSSIVRMQEEMEEKNRIIEQIREDFISASSNNDHINQSLYDALKKVQSLKQAEEVQRKKIGQLELEVENNKNELDFTDQTWRKEKEENELREERYRAYIKTLEDKIIQLQSNTKSRINSSKIRRQSGSNLDHEEMSKGSRKSNILVKDNSSIKGNLESSINRRSLSPSFIDGNREDLQNNELLEEIQRLEEEIRTLIAENQSLKDELEKLKQLEEKVQNYKEMEIRMKELEEKMLQNQIELNEKQKEENQEKNHRIQELEKQLNQIGSEVEKVKKQRDEFQHKYKYLTVEMANYMKKNQPTIEQIKYIQICDSEEEEQRVIDEMRKQQENKVPDPFEDEEQKKPSSDHERAKSQTKEQSKKVSRIKRAATFQVENEEKKTIKKESSQQIVEEIDQSILNSEIPEGLQIIKSQKKKTKFNQKQIKSKMPQFSEKSSVQKEKIEQYSDKNSESKKINQISTIQKPKLFDENSEKIIKSSFPKSKLDQSKNIATIRYTIDQSISQKREKTQSREPSREQSNHSKSKSKTSRESFISGNTLYKFQKVSHREKIKRLEEELQNLKNENQELQVLNEEILKESKIQRQKNSEMMEQLLEKQRSFMKQSEVITKIQDELRFQIDRKKGISVAVESNIPDSESEKVKQEKNKLTLEFGELSNSLLREREKFRELSAQLQSIKSEYALLEKDFAEKVKMYKDEIEGFVYAIDESEKKRQYLLLKYEEKDGELQKVKKEYEQKEREFKDSYQQLRFQKAQVQFELSTSLTDLKRLKGKNEDLEEKVRKNDIQDLLRQSQFEAETANKKIVEFNRLIYQMRLQKDTIEDEMKLLRKKMNDLQKKNLEKDDQSERLLKNAEDLKRVENKLKRDLEDKQDNIQKLRDQIKRQDEQISNLRNERSQGSFEKKKLMDELSSFQHMIEKKQYEVMSLKKELERMRRSLQEKDQEKFERKNALRKQLEKMEQILVQKQKEIIGLEATVKQLENRLEINKSESKRNMNEKYNTLGDKIKLYVEEIAHFKRTIEQNNYEINLLKHQLFETSQELQQCKNLNNRLDQRVLEEEQNNTNLFNSLQSTSNENQTLKEKYIQMEFDVESIKNSLKVLKIELEREKKQKSEQKQKNQQLLKQINEFQDQISKNKVTISNYQIQTQISKNIGEKLTMNDQEIQSLMKELRQVKLNFDEYRTKFVHSPTEFQSAIRKAEKKITNEFSEKIMKANSQHQEHENIQRKKFEEQIVNLLNEISRVRAESQTKSEIISDLEQKVSKLEILPIKLDELTTLFEEKSIQNTKFRAFGQQNQTLREKLKVLEEKITDTQVQNKKIKQNLLESENKNQEISLYLNQLRSEARNLATENTQLYKKISQLQKNEESLKHEIQQLLRNHKKLEEQKEDLIKQIDNIKKENLKKINSLEQKLEEVSETVIQHENALKNHYEEKLDELSTSITKATKELEEKNRIIMDCENIIDELENNCGNYLKQIKILSQDKQKNQQAYFSDLESLKERMMQNQRKKDKEIQSMEKEIQELMKENNIVKMQVKNNFSLNNANNSEGNQLLSINLRRMEEKCRMKDTRIEQLKQNVFVLEQTIIKLKKKEAQLSENQEQLQKLEKINKQITDELGKLELEFQNSMNRDNSLLMGLKNEMRELKEEKEKKTLEVEEKSMELQSVKYELKTTKELYFQLQNELEKRKKSFRDKVQSESKISEQLHLKNQVILQLEATIDEQKHSLKEKEEELERKMQIIANYDSKITNLESSEMKMKTALFNKANSEGQHYKQEINRLTSENQSLQNRNKKLREQIESLEKRNFEAKTHISDNESSLIKIHSNMEQLAKKYEQREQSHRKLTELKQKCFNLLGVTLEEAFIRGYIAGQIEEKNYEINSLLQEVEELKFLNERKSMDYDQLKRQNCELHVKVEDLCFASEQVEELRVLCDKLETEKKQGSFREEALLIQFQKALQYVDGSMKRVLESNMRMLYNNHFF